MYNARTRMFLVFFITFFATVVVGFIVLWSMPLDERLNQIAILGLIIGSFVLALISAVGVGLQKPRN